MFCIKPSEKSCGAEVCNVQVKTMDLFQVLELKKLLYQHQVLFFTDQEMSVSEFESFCLKFGPFSDSPYLDSINKDHPFVVSVERSENEKSSDVSLYGGEWHADFTMKKHPPDFTFLYSEIIPQYGGDTLFSNQVMALETLNDSLANFIKDKQAYHSAQKGWGIDGSFSKNNDQRTMKIQIDPLANENGYIHPLVFEHPISKSKSLYCNKGFVSYIVGTDEVESSETLEKLFKHQVQPSLVFRLKWKPKMLAIWDNRLVIHKATGGYDGHARKLLRIQTLDDSNSV